MGMPSVVNAFSSVFFNVGFITGGGLILVAKYVSYEVAYATLVVNCCLFMVITVMFFRTSTYTEMLGKTGTNEESSQESKQESIYSVDEFNVAPPDEFNNDKGV